jgi:hypothetical protein
VLFDLLPLKAKKAAKIIIMPARIPQNCLDIREMLLLLLPVYSRPLA